MILQLGLLVQSYLSHDLVWISEVVLQDDVLVHLEFDCAVQGVGVRSPLFDPEWIWDHILFRNDRPNHRSCIDRFSAYRVLYIWISVDALSASCGPMSIRSVWTDSKTSVQEVLPNLLESKFLIPKILPSPYTVWEYEGVWSFVTLGSGRVSGSVVVVCFSVERRFPHLPFAGSPSLSRFLQIWVLLPIVRKWAGFELQSALFWKSHIPWVGSSVCSTVWYLHGYSHQLLTRSSQFPWLRWDEHPLIWNQFIT